MIFQHGDLNKHYLERINHLKNKARELNKLVSNYFVSEPLLSIFLYLSYFFLLQLFEVELGNLLSLFFLLSFLVFIFYFVFLYRAFSTFKNSITRQVSSKNLKGIDSEKFPAVAKMVYDISNKMEIEKKINIYVSNQNSYLPSIEEYSREVYLILPKNFLLLVRKFPKRAESLLAHEFGHVLQEDTETWKKIVFFLNFKIKKKTLIDFINALYYLIFIIGLFFLPWQGALFLFASVYRNYRTSKQISEMMKYRSTSEELADTAAIIYSDGYKLCESILHYVRDDALERVHPLKNQRRSWIIRTMKRWDIPINLT
ncbi:MAG: hypothetical protein H6573_02085 [Lewinellaceae bacterium]|nr:hypothetical protein [Phaeodactylibacter sp.]MCB9346286.1 hypothetical protein [Lewinellaceae bacterium]